MNIYHLYIKTHSISGLQYLGITKKSNPHSYTGSGHYWKRHLHQHGKLYTTTIIQTCYTLTAIAEWGLYYSKLWNIADSKKWANLVPEAGYGRTDNKNKVVAKDENGNIIQIDTKDFYTNKQKYTGHTANQITLIDPLTNQKVRTHKNDTRLLSGELVSHKKGMTTVKNIKTGETFNISTNDPMLNSPDIVGINKGMAVFIDIHSGKKIRAPIDDPRRISGELIHENQGKKKPRVLCNFCNKDIGINNISYHESSCILNPHRTIRKLKPLDKIECTNCGRFIAKTQYKSHCTSCIKKLST
jgi:hypothetical protein